jgi:hypothetical protein
LEAPFAEVIFSGYVHIYGTFIYKLLKTPPGDYYVEIPLGGGSSLLSPARYYRHSRRDKRGGGAGIFQLPLDTWRTLVAWGFHEPGTDAIYTYVKIWSANNLFFI